MEHNTSEGKILGLVLDISLRHMGETRILDDVKNSLVSFAKETLDGEDLFYLYHPDITEPVMDVGAAVSTIGNYETDGLNISLRNALLQTYFVLDAEDGDWEKAFMYVTDRVQDDHEIKKVLAMSKRDGVDCTYIFIGIGSHYNREILDHPNVTYKHLDDPKDLHKFLME